MPIRAPDRASGVRRIPGDSGRPGTRRGASTTGCVTASTVCHMDSVGGRVQRLQWERDQPRRVRHWAMQREAQIRKTVQEFLDWAARNGVQSRTMQGCWLSFFTGWELGETSRSDVADPAFGTPDFDTEQGRTWYLRVSRSGRIRVVVRERRRRLGWMLRPAARPLSDFPIEAVEEAIAQTVLASGETWP